MTVSHPGSNLPSLRPARRINGMSAVLLTSAPDGDIDWSSFEAHVDRTAEAGLVPAVNMDTGYVQLLDQQTREAVLDRTAAVTAGRFVAGAFVDDEPGSELDLKAHIVAAQAVAARGGIPVIFPSHGLNSLAEPQLIGALATIGEEVDRFIGFELGPQFIPHGRIYTLAAYEMLMGIPQCVGAKHSSLRRGDEWNRLAIRDRVRPQFSVMTGNDLAIDMVMYGSDYLLGLSTFAPDVFARRDRMWATGDPGFFELNDLLQYLGNFAFRTPVPAYRHSAAMFLHLRGWATSESVPRGVPTRPESDRAILAEIACRMGVL